MEFDLSIYEATIIPAIMFITYIAKQMRVSSRFLPLTALLTGIVAGLLFISFDTKGLLIGILAGAASIGFHSGSKNTFQMNEK